jgi:hypothetical protein
MKIMRTKLSLMLLFLPGLLTGQAQSKIWGKVFNAEDKPLARASILLLNPKDSALVKGTLTNETGGYSFENIAAGEYIISAAYAGLDQLYTPKFTVAEMENHEVENIKLQATKELQELS